MVATVEQRGPHCCYTHGRSCRAGSKEHDSAWLASMDHATHVDTPAVMPSPLPPGMPRPTQRACCAPCATL